MKLPAQPLRVNAVAYVISSSLEEDPSPYPWCKVREHLAPGQKVVIWNSTAGEPIRSESQPQSTLRADYVPDARNAPDNPAISFVIGGTPCLSSEVRDMIETLEPGVHQFFPVEIYGVDGNIREPRRYLLNICQLVDAIVEGRYAVLNDGSRLYRASSRNPIKIRRQDVSDLHLWRDRRLAYQVFLVSDVLYRKIAHAGYGAFDLGLSEEV
jgi:hypothetical protein